MRILFVDDNDDLLDIMKGILGSYGAQVQTCNSGLVAYDLVCSKTSNLFILDIQIPKVTGESLIKLIRQHPDPIVNTVPAIALTSHYRELQDKARLLQEGFNQYFLKPPDQTDFLSCLETHAQEIERKERHSP